MNREKEMFTACTTALNKLEAKTTELEASVAQLKAGTGKAGDFQKTARELEGLCHIAIGQCDAYLALPERDPVSETIVALMKSLAELDLLIVQLGIFATR